MKTFKTIIKWIGIVLGGLILLVLVVRIILDIVFSIQLRDTLRDLKAQGVPLTAAEIAPPPVPDADNAALPIQEAMELMPKWTSTNSGALKSLTDFIETNQIPGKVGTDIAGWTEAQREEGTELIQSEEVKDWYALLVQAANRPRYNNNLDYSQGLGMMTPNLSNYRMMFRILGVKTGFEAKSKNMDIALDTILIGLTINNKLNAEPTLITQLVRIACDNLLIGTLERMADAADLPSDEMRSLAAELSLRTNMTSWVKAMERERFEGMWTFDYISRASIKEISIFTSQFENTCAQYVGVPIIRSIIKKDEIIYLRLLSKVQRSFELPYYQIADVIKAAPIEQQIPRYAIITRIILPSLEKVRETAARHQAEVEVCRVGLALKLFKQQAGVYPDTLDALAPEFLKFIPVDPFTGKSLVYRKDGDGFLLYSLGPNLKDDGGKARVPADYQSKDYDIVWKCGK